MRTVADLVLAQAAGERVRFVYFWSHEPRPGGSGAHVLSQWYEAPFDIDGQRYPTAEHWMMAEKARLFRDDAAEAAILAAAHPGEAKALGAEVRGFDDSTWLANRVAIVLAGNLAKFVQNPELGTWLAGTGARVLVEASPRDHIWGIGLAADHPDAAHPARWRGTNLLGFALMEVRDRLA